MKVGDIVKIQNNDKKILGKITKFIDDDKCMVQYKKWSDKSGTLEYNKKQVYSREASAWQGQ